MRKLLAITLTVCLPGVLASCKTREERAIDRLESLQEKIERQGADWDLDQWADALEDIQDIHYDLEDCDFTPEQAGELLELEGRLTNTIVRQVARKTIL